MSRSTYFELPRPRILAHRGLALDAPENTLLAFAHALAAGAAYLETDVHASSDGVAVISHDPDLSRLVGRTTRVGDLAVADLERIDLGDGQSFCSLATALDAFPDARFNIDIKSADAAAPAAQAILAAGATGRVLVTSFSNRRRRAAMRLLPDVATSAAALPFAVALAALALGLRPIARIALRGVGAVQIPESWMLGPIRVAVVTPRSLRGLHALGVEVHVWTVNEPTDMARLLDLGVDGLVTDRCDLAVQVLAQRG